MSPDWYKWLYKITKWGRIGIPPVQEDSDTLDKYCTLKEVECRHMAMPLGWVTATLWPWLGWKALVSTRYGKQEGEASISTPYWGLCIVTSFHRGRYEVGLGSTWQWRILTNTAPVIKGNNSGESYWQSAPSMWCDVMSLALHLCLPSPNPYPLSNPERNVGQVPLEGQRDLTYKTPDQESLTLRSHQKQGMPEKLSQPRGV